MSQAIYYAIFCAACVSVLKEVNSIVTEPYMDEPFHIPQAQAYCRGDFWTWDPKITTPPGLYLLSLLLKRVFMFKCTLPMLRLTTTLTLLSLPPALTRLLCFHKRIRPPVSLLSPTLDSLILGAFPIAWFFGFLYYTEAPSLLFVVLTVVAASQDRHWLAALLGLVSCTFRQTNVIWVLYAFASSQLMYLRFMRAAPGAPPPRKLHDRPALESTPSIGDKAHHVPVLHVPQLYYFIAFATAFGWPALISGPDGPLGLALQVHRRMFGSKMWYLVLPNVSYLGREQTLLQTLVLPIFILPTLLPTPLLEPRYFLIPFILLRAQVGDMSGWALVLEVSINVIKSDDRNACGELSTMTVSTVNLVNLRNAKNAVIGNPSAKSCTPPSIAIGSDEALVALLRANAPHALLFALAHFTKDDSSAIRAAFARALRAIAVSAADAVGPSLWGLGPGSSIAEDDAHDTLEFLFHASLLLPLNTDALDTLLPLLTDVPISQVPTSICQLIASVIRSPQQRVSITEWLPLTERTKAKEKEMEGGINIVRPRRGWEKAVVAQGPARMGGWTVRQLVALLGAGDVKLQEAALGALAALAKDNVEVSGALSRPGLGKEGWLFNLRNYKHPEGK
ncbi:hypothetical protein H0H93_013014 [Arthromyces matolae]|nr:hypothetical protein H0H93_013014 [Arthromyces matolae]